VPIRSLSGGNQQKVIIGKWLLMDPDIMLMDDPTRGIDVGAKYEIYQLIINFAKSGKGVIMASSEMPELLGISDRIIVLSNGRISDIYDLRKNPKEATQENIFKSAAKYL
jgi:methyl-galactoside transport system ATP-binding protein